MAFAFLLGLFALARWGGRVIRPIISAGDAELTTILLVGFGVFVAGFAHTSAPRTPSARCWPEWSSPARGSGRASSG